MRLRRPQGTVSLATPPAEAGAALQDVADPAPDPGEQLLSQELLGQIEAAILVLPDTLRAAVVLRNIEGLNTGEAAAALGIRESALKARLHRGRLALRTALTPYLAPPPAGETP